MPRSGGVVEGGEMTNSIDELWEVVRSVCKVGWRGVGVLK